LVFTLGALGLPVAAFLIVYCGMPADIKINQHTGLVSTSEYSTYGSAVLYMCCIRSGRELYDTVHTMWHIASGLGPLLAIWYFDYVKNKDANTYEFATNVLPVASVGAAVVVNVLGNIFDIMPLQ
jgi:hypothetical protein